MKKMVAGVLLLALLLGIVGCGESSTAKVPELSDNPVVTQPQNTETTEQENLKAMAQKAEALIESIGVVRVESEAAILAAKEAYTALPESAKAYVGNAEKLQAAEATLVLALAAQLDARITAMDEVTLENASVVDEVWNDYNGADADVQAAVAAYETLAAAKETVDTLRAKEVTGLIAAIGKVTLKKEEAILLTEAAYNALDPSAVEKVSNADALVKARTKLDALYKDAAMNKLQTKTDKKQAVTWYRSKTEPKYASTRSYVLPYFGVKEDAVKLRLRIHYAGADWVFFENVVLTVDGTEYAYTFDYFDVQRDNQGSKVWEWIDLDVTQTEEAMLLAMAEAETVTIRFAGDRYEAELTMEETDKQAIRDVLDGFAYFL